MAPGTKPDMKDFEKLPLEDLERMQNELSGFVEKRKQNRKKEALKKVKDLVQEHGLSYDEVTAAIRTTAKRGKAPAIYRNPAKPRQTWSGKGEPPQWYVDAPDKNALKIPDD